MCTGADGPGGRPQTNMFLWQSLPGSFYAPCVDGDYDMTVIGHEYGHAIENRMIGKGVGARQGFHAGAMGEAFGDFDALEYRDESHYRAGAGLGPLDRGRVRHGQPLQRHPRLPRERADGRRPSRSPGRTRTPTRSTSATIGFDIVGPEVHADGEIWVAVAVSTSATCSSSATRRAHAAQDIDCLRGQ